MPPSPLLTIVGLRKLVLHAATAAGLMLGLVVMGSLFEVRGAPCVAAAITTAFMVRTTVALTMRNADRVSVQAARVMGWAALMGVLNAPACFLAAGIVDHPSIELLPMTLMAGVFGLPWGLSLGLLFGMVLALLVFAVEHAQHHATPTALDRGVMLVGVWLAVLSVVVLAMRWVAAEEPIGRLLFGGHSSRNMLPAAVVLAASAGVLLIALGAWRQFARRRWVQRVASGQVPGWQLVDATPDDIDDEMLPSLDTCPSGFAQLLLHQEVAGNGAYRRTQTERRIALVPSWWSDSPW